MSKLIDVWVCQNESHRDLCVNDSSEIIRGNTGGWCGAGIPGELGWRWITPAHPSHELFYEATIYPNKVRAKMLVNGHSYDEENLKLI